MAFQRREGAYIESDVCSAVNWQFPGPTTAVKTTVDLCVLVSKQHGKQCPDPAFRNPKRPPGFFAAPVRWHPRPRESACTAIPHGVVGLGCGRARTPDEQAKLHLIPYRPYRIVVLKPWSPIRLRKCTFRVMCLSYPLLQAKTDRPTGRSNEFPQLRFGSADSAKEQGWEHFIVIFGPLQVAS